MRTPLYKKKEYTQIKTNDDVGSKTSVTDTYSILRRYPHDAHIVLRTMGKVDETRQPDSRQGGSLANRGSGVVKKEGGKRGRGRNITHAVQ